MMKKQVLVLFVMLQVVFLMLGVTAFSEEGMQTLADRFEMTNKMGLYTFAWDENTPEEFRNVYTDDVVFETWKPGKQEILYRVEGLQANIDRNMKMIGGLRKNGGACRHNLSNVVFLELTENTATTKTVYTFSLFRQIDAEPVIISGTFNDSWIKMEKGWFIKERVVIYDNFPAALAQPK